MAHVTAPKVTAAGIGVLILAQVLYVRVLATISHHKLLRWVLLGAPGFAACITAYLSPNWKLLTGTSMALYGAAIGMLSAMLYESFDLPVDRIGGPLATFAVLLVYYAALSIVGSEAGMTLSRILYRHA